MNIDEIKSNLLREGWSSFELMQDDKALIEISAKFGTLIPDNNGQIIQYLKPKEKSEAIKDSFSYNFEYSAFPFHTDTAFWPIPIRCIVMKSENKSSCETFLFDSEQIFSDLCDRDILVLKKAVFLLKNKSVQKYTSLIVNDNGKRGIRYDPNIMFPVNHFANLSIHIIKKCLETQSIIKFEWTGNNALLLDNWRFLHSRGDATNDKTRLLKRIYLNI